MADLAPLIETGDDVEPTVCFGLFRKRIFPVAVLGVGFFFIFFGFFASQDYMTSVLPEGLGNISLAALYGSYAFFAFAGPVIFNSIGERTGVVAGSFFYAVFISSLVYPRRDTVVAASALLGLGAALMWVGQGAIMTACCRDSERGRVAGAFWACFEGGIVTGNLAATALYDVLGVQRMFVSLAVASGIGFLVFAFGLWPVPKQTQRWATGSAPPSSASVNANAHDGMGGEPVKHSGLSRMLLSLKIVLSPSTAVLVPLFVFAGVEMSFWSGEFPQLIAADRLGVVLAFVGIGGLCSSYPMGMITDRFGNNVSLTIGSAIMTLALALTSVFLANGHTGGSVWGVPVVGVLAALCFGAADSVVNTQVMARLGAIHPAHNAVEAFCVSQLMQNLGSMAGYLYAPAWPMKGNLHTDGGSQSYVQPIVVLATMAIAVVGAFASSRIHSKEKTIDNIIHMGSGHVDSS